MNPVTFLVSFQTIPPLASLPPTPPCCLNPPCPVPYSSSFPFLSSFCSSTALLILPASTLPPPPPVTPLTSSLLSSAAAILKSQWVNNNNNVEITIQRILAQIKWIKWLTTHFSSATYLIAMNWWIIECDWLCRLMVVMIIISWRKFCKKLQWKIRQ